MARESSRLTHQFLYKVIAPVLSLLVLDEILKRLAHQLTSLLLNEELRGTTVMSRIDVFYNYIYVFFRFLQLNKCCDSAKSEKSNAKHTCSY